MFYQFHELTHAALQPYRAVADATRLFFSNPLNPLSHTPWGRSMAAGSELFERTTRLCEGLRAAASANGVPFTTNHAGTMFGGFFTGEQHIRNYAQVIACDIPAFNQFFHRMLELGVYLAPASYEAGFMSSAHSDQDIADTVAAAATAMAGL